jgi:hypothetical protein
MIAAVAAAVAMTMTTAGCDEPNTLSGSITDSHDLSFDSVRLRLFTDQDAYELRYEKLLDSGDNDIVAKVICDAPEGGITLNTAIDIIESNGNVERITARNDPFPGVERGDLTFTSGAVDDGEVSTGEWGATFDNGKTIEGTFEIELEHASFEN